MVGVSVVALPMGQGCPLGTQGNLVATRCHPVTDRFTIEPWAGVTGRGYPGHTGRPAQPDGGHGRTEQCGEGAGTVRAVAVSPVPGRRRLPVRTAAPAETAALAGPGRRPALTGTRTARCARCGHRG